VTTKTPRVLLINDEAPLRLMCRVNLESEGMALIEAADGFEGLDLARVEQPDLILLDTAMPGIDGWQVAQRLRERPRRERSLLHS
jgi:CheY-like chemotaxis protein